MSKDWVGNKASTFKCLGASSHTDHDRAEFDYYATDPIAAKLLLEVEPDLDNIWECAVGEKHLAKVFEDAGKLGRMSDVVNRTDDDRVEIVDFLARPSGLLAKKEVWNGSIVTNPPYAFSLPFVQRALELVPNGRKVCMFLKLTFLEGKERKQFFIENPPKCIYVSSSRITCAMNGEFYKPKMKDGKEVIGADSKPVMEKQSSAVCYAWFVWEKGFKGDPIIKWIN